MRFNITKRFVVAIGRTPKSYGGDTLLEIINLSMFNSRNLGSFVVRICILGFQLDLFFMYNRERCEAYMKSQAALVEAILKQGFFGRDLQVPEPQSKPIVH